MSGTKHKAYLKAKIDAECCLSDFYTAVNEAGLDFSDELKDLVWDATQGKVVVSVE